jgi:hypothetical protein
MEKNSKIVNLDILLEIRKDIEGTKSALIELAGDSILEFGKKFQNKSAINGEVFSMCFVHPEDENYTPKNWNGHLLYSVAFIYNSDIKRPLITLRYDNEFGLSQNANHFSIEEIETLLNHIYTEWCYAEEII